MNSTATDGGAARRSAGSCASASSGGRTSGRVAPDTAPSFVATVLTGRPASPFGMTLGAQRAMARDTAFDMDGGCD
ncbi:protein of unknown function [Methylorubrum extorquens]|uniref:Uncharacterized protein n=1 Tax=Methylorubrum extorquens TaxID=408 RepID=A0A2N9ASU8_METEX|nr:protein of unknown function [Methylorubrum extorquens]